MSLHLPPDHDVRLWAAAKLQRPANAILTVRLVAELDDDADPIVAFRVEFIDLSGEHERAQIPLPYGGLPFAPLVDDIRATAQAARATTEIRSTLPRRKHP